MSKLNTHVIASVGGGWSVRRSGSDRAEKTFETKEEAVRYGRKVARARSSDLVIHRKDGLVSERSTYGTHAFATNSRK
jgi:Uncharacterized protein conserved in bacteria (DUF2188)